MHNLQLSLCFSNGSLDRLDGFWVGLPAGSDNAFVGTQCSALGKVEWGAIHVGTDSTRLFNEKAT